METPQAILRMQVLWLVVPSVICMNLKGHFGKGPRVNLKSPRVVLKKSKGHLVKVKGSSGEKSKGRFKKVQGSSGKGPRVIW
jgi:hypothetical protein